MITAPPPARVAAGVEHFERFSRTHRRTQQITSLTWRGWVVYVVDDAAVTVPTQPTQGKSTAELAALLRSAYSMLSVGDRCSGPSTGLRQARPGSQAAGDVAEVLSAAAVLVGRCRRGGIDVYAALVQAWTDAQMVAPFCAVLAAVRPVLGDCTLADFADSADSVAAVALLHRAEELACGRTSPEAITA
ncbi:MAG: hypothetical protein K0U84_20435 [Actinomycetia bacterium]|nr:hypothetical protein [Actinomycetes bacterium]